MQKPWRTTTGLVALVSLAFALATLLIGFTVYEVAHEALEEQLDHRIGAETLTLLAEYRRGGLDALTAAIAHRDEARGADGADGLGYLVVDAAGLRLAGRLDAEAPAEPGYLEHLSHDRGRRDAQALTTVMPEGGRLVVAADREAIDETDATVFTVTAAAFGALLLLGVAAAWTIGSVTRARLRDIDRTALAIIEGDLARRMPRDGSGSEFDRVSATLNRMLDRIGSLMDNLRQVSGDVAHDLRTPLTRLNNRLGEALARDRDPVALRAAIEAALADAGELLDLFAALLRIAEVEALSARRQFATLAVDSLLEEVLDAYAPDIEASGRHLVRRIEPGLSLIGDRRLLRQLIANLLDNALRHTPAGTTIEVRLEPRATALQLTIDDDGPGVPAEELPRLFQRFSRAERSRHTEGHGLGLALVAAIAAAHRGEASASSDGGFRVKIELPRPGG